MQKVISLSWRRHLVLRRLFIGALFVLGFWIYYPALSLPPSLIDDYPMLKNSDQWIRHLSKGEFQTALRNDVGMHQRTFDTGFMLFNTLRYYITGNHPYQWIRLLELVAVCCAIFMFVYRVRGRTTTSMLGASAAVAMLLTTEVPGGVDMHAIRVSWMRLFTADPDALLFLSAHMAAFFLMLRNLLAGRGYLMYAMLAVVCGALTFSIKVPYLGVVCGPLGMTAILLLFLRQKKAAAVTAVLLASILAIFALYYLVLRQYATPADLNTYSASFSLHPSHLLNGLAYFVRMYWNALGPLLPALIAGNLLLLWHFWRQRNTPQRMTVVAFIYGLTLAGCAVCAYVPWNHRLPRYLLGSLFGLSLVTGICVDYGLAALPTAWTNEPRVFLLLPVGIGVVFCPIWLLLVFVILAVIIGITRYGRYSHAFIAGVGISALLFQAITLPVSRSAANNVYIGGENANWQITVGVIGAAATGLSICYPGDVNNEYIGSLTGYLQRLGIAPKFYAVTDPRCTSETLILVNRLLTPPEEIQKLKDLKIVYETTLPKSAYEVPMSFWKFRKLLFTPGAKKYLTQTWYSRYVWRMYKRTPAVPG